MNKRKYIIKYLIIGVLCGSFYACSDFWDTRIDSNLTDKNLASKYNYIWNFGYAPYTYLTDGFINIDKNLFAAVTDEAQQTSLNADARYFNQGTWNAFNNPADVYASCYKGIRAANYFLEKYADYKTILALNRDTVSDHQYQYKVDVFDIEKLRAESQILKAYFYFELIKRYGGVPIVKNLLEINDNCNIPRSSFEEVVEYIIELIDQTKDNLVNQWGVDPIPGLSGAKSSSGNAGRITKSAALALKSRVLLYAASPLHNPENKKEKWERAAQAAYDVINLNLHMLDNNYSELFLGNNPLTSYEVIWAYRQTEINNWLETANYPIGTIGGKSGVTPSQNLVDAYEYTGTPDPLDPYKNRDPRLAYTIVTNGSKWNGRTIEIFPGGKDDYTNTNASRTGYYLKKFMNDNLDLKEGAKAQHNWIIFRYAEILLNYAESMNEAYGPDNRAGYGLSARQAINLIRNRNSVKLGPVSANSYQEMKDKIKHERHIELAFEDHRWWDLVRWKDAETTLNKPLMGIKAIKYTEGKFRYTTFKVEDRIFYPHMYLFPIPQSEITKSNGILKQNPGW